MDQRDRQLILSDDRPTNGNGRIKIAPGTLLQLLGIVVAALVTYGMVTARIAVLESKQGYSDERLRRIEEKVDLLLRRP